MTDIQQKTAAKAFSKYWEGKGYEKGESQPFWLSLLRDVFDVAEPDKQLLRDNLAAIRHFESAVGECGEGLAAYAPVKVAWLYSGLCTRTLVFGERGVWETYLGEPPRFSLTNRRGSRRGACVGGCAASAD